MGGRSAATGGFSDHPPTRSVGCSGHKFINQGVPKSNSGWFASCVATLVDPDTDLVFLEFAVNDQHDADETSIQRCAGAGWGAGLAGCGAGPGQWGGAGPNSLFAGFTRRLASGAASQTAGLPRPG